MTTISINYCSHVTFAQKRAFVLKVKALVDNEFVWAKENIIPESCIKDMLILHCDFSLSYTCMFVSKLNDITINTDGIFISSIFYH